MKNRDQFEHILLGRRPPPAPPGSKMEAWCLENSIITPCSTSSERNGHNVEICIGSPGPERLRGMFFDTTFCSLLNIYIPTKPVRKKQNKYSHEGETSQTPTSYARGRVFPLYSQLPFIIQFVSFMFAAQPTGPPRPPLHVLSVQCSCRGPFHSYLATLPSSPHRIYTRVPFSSTRRSPGGAYSFPLRA